MSKKIVFILMMLAIYLIGILSGVFVGGYFAMKRGFIPGGFNLPLPPPHGDRMPGGPPKHMVDRFAKRLNLTDDQKEKVIQILENNKGSIDKYRDEFNSKMKKTIDDVNQKIKVTLTDEQKIVFEKIIKELPEIPGGHGKGPGIGPEEGRENLPPENR